MLADVESAAILNTRSPRHEKSLEKPKPNPNLTEGTIGRLRHVDNYRLILELGKILNY